LVGRRTPQLGAKRGNQRDALAATEMKFRALIEHSTDGILLLDRNHRVLFSSTAVQRILGYSTSKIIGQNFGELVHPEERAEMIRLWRHCPPGGTENRLSRVRHASGQWRDLECVYSNLLHEPRVRGIVINFRDVTESSLAAEALRKSEEKFSKAFRSSPLAISISTKAEGIYLDVNDAFLRTFGYARADIIGQSSLQLGIWAEPEQRKALMRELEHRSLVTGLRATFKTKKGDLCDAEIAAEPIDLGGTPCVLAITRDVTETRHLEAQLRHVQKMEAVGRLAGGVAHDFNNFLMVMRSYAQLIELQSRDPSIKDHSKRIVDAADRGANISRQLLAFSRKQPQQLRKLDLNRTVSDFCKLLPGFIGEDVKLRVSVGGEPAVVMADQGQVEQVIMNLAVNARDAMPSGGQLAVEVSQVQLGENASEYHGARIPPGDYVVLAVSDTGCGIDETTRPKIFEPFFTTKETGKGTGLGLATVYGIVKQHGGFIWVYSEVGLGSVFKIYLPQLPEGAVDDTIRLSTTDQSSSGNQTVLLVEDEDALVEVIAQYLALRGYKVLKAKDGETALRVAKAAPEPIDLLLTDIVMPGMRGTELARKVARIHKAIKIVFMSGYSESTLHGEGVVIQKPVDLGVLAEKIGLTLALEPTPRTPLRHGTRSRAEKKHRKSGRPDIEQ